MMGCAGRTGVRPLRKMYQFTSIAMGTQQAKTRSRASRKMAGWAGRTGVHPLRKIYQFTSIAMGTQQQAKTRPPRVPKNGGAGGTHRGASPTKDCQHEMKHAVQNIKRRGEL